MSRETFCEADWTRYALDEVTDPQESLRLAESLAIDPEAAQQVRQTRHLAKWLSDTLSWEADRLWTETTRGDLRPMDRLALASRLHAERRGTQPPRRRIEADSGPPAWVPVGVAACVVLTFLMAVAGVVRHEMLHRSWQHRAASMLSDAGPAASQPTLTRETSDATR